MTAVFVAIFGLLGVITTSLVTYLVARRSKSGQIISSEAADLWAESGRIRTDLQSELERLRVELRASRADLRAADERAAIAEERWTAAQASFERCQERLREFVEWRRQGSPHQGSDDDSLE